ncbi:MAG: hypothetical protein IJ841_05410 [Prevotella sp.]|nr:hypothetical protein [Prevotella sp.]
MKKENGRQSYARILYFFNEHTHFCFSALRLPEILHDQADGEEREVLGVAGLVDGGKDILCKMKFTGGKYAITKIDEEGENVIV